MVRPTSDYTARWPSRILFEWVPDGLWRSRARWSFEPWHTCCPDQEDCDGSDADEPEGGHAFSQDQTQIEEDGRSTLTDIPYTAHMACDYRPNHRIYMSFFLRSGWLVSFLEPDLKTPLPRTFNFADPEKIRDLARRGQALGTLEGKQMLEQAIETGRGGLLLTLTHEQYAKLARP
jgi:hypothetical protein